jgi:hypothetical protein
MQFLLRRLEVKARRIGPGWAYFLSLLGQSCIGVKPKASFSVSIKNF